ASTMPDTCFALETTMQANMMAQDRRAKRGSRWRMTEKSSDQTSIVRVPLLVSVLQNSDNRARAAQRRHMKPKNRCVTEKRLLEYAFMEKNDFRTRFKLFWLT